MATTHERLEALEEALEAQGADRIRLEIVRRARVFKRSWVDMAEALSMVRSKGLYEQWGYGDFHGYCQTELLLTRATVDKLTGTFQTVREHAPQVLARDGVGSPVPSIDAVDYFAKALRSTEPEQPANDWSPPPETEEAIEDLKQAVFDENKSIAVLRKDFGPIFFSKSEEQQRAEALEKTRGAARRLEGLLARLAEQELMDEEQVDEVVRSLARLREALDGALSDAKAAVGEAKRKAS